MRVLDVCAEVAIQTAFRVSETATVYHLIPFLSMAKVLQVIKSLDEACVVSVTMSTHLCLMPRAKSFLGQVGARMGKPHTNPMGSLT